MLSFRWLWRMGHWDAALALLLVDCTPARSRTSDIRATARVDRATPALPTLVAVPTAAQGSGSAAAAASSVSTSAERPERTTVAGSTKHTIACGKQRCSAGKEACVMPEGSQEWTCVPAGEEANGDTYACDDASDCDAPKVCCRSFASAVEFYACEQPEGDCAAVVCVEGDGASCPKGRRCVEGYCDSDHRATCAGERHCPQSAPYCLWSSAPSCADRAVARDTADKLGDPEAPFGIYACTKPSDCGSGLSCCTSVTLAERLTNCSQACDLANSMALCNKDADCGAAARVYCRDDRACRARVRCVPPRDIDPPNSTPPWMKVCLLND